MVLWFVLYNVAAYSRASSTHMLGADKGLRFLGLAATFVAAGLLKIFRTVLFAAGLLGLVADSVRVFFLLLPVLVLHSTRHCWFNGSSQRWCILKS